MRSLAEHGVCHAMRGEPCVAIERLALVAADEVVALCPVWVSKARCSAGLALGGRAARGRAGCLGPRMASISSVEPASPIPRRAAATSAKPGRLRAMGGLLGASYDRLQRHAGDSLAGGLAFGALLSVAPLLLVVIAIGSLLFGSEVAQGETIAVVGDTLGESAQGLVAEWVWEAQTWSGGATAIGLVLFLYGASRLVGLVDQAFEIVFEVPPKPKMRFLDSLKLWLRTQATQIFVTFAAGIVMVASLALRGLGASIFGAATDPAVGVVWAIVREVVSTSLWFGAMCVVYAMLPPVKLSRSDVVIGAALSAVLVEVPLLALRLLASYFDFGAAYGAAGAVVGVLVTLSIVGTLFLYGAEVTAERADRRDGKPTDRLTERRTRCVKAWEDRARALGKLPPAPDEDCDAPASATKP
jgi:membrane protein